MKPFNLEEAKAGQAVITKNGNPVRIICFDRKMENSPLVGLVSVGAIEILVDYTMDGKTKSHLYRDMDLFMKDTWYENIPTDGILCWVNSINDFSAENRIIDLIIRFNKNVNHYITINGITWPYAKPLSKEEILSLADNVPEETSNI